MRCECGVDLFECDIVETTLGGKYGDEISLHRCPRCFKINGGIE